jgi:hypothetical protein
MPPASVDPERLRSLGAALAPLRTCAAEGAEEVLAQFPELGDRETQAALDGWVEQLADLLREIDATASDLADGLRVAALSADGREPPSAPQAPTGPPSRQPASEATHDGLWSHVSGEGSR